MSFDRLASGHREGITAALDAIPPSIRDRLRHVSFLTGVDPIFAGLHSHEQMSFGRSYRDTAHFVSPFYGGAATAVVLPTPEDPAFIVHELGHALDEVLGFAIAPAPVTWYAATSRVESFAEAWSAWIAENVEVPTPKWREYRALAKDIDAPTRAVFEALESSR